MTSEGSAQETNLLAHPEMKDVFETVLSTLVYESDRGAVLIGASIVEEHLRKLFEEVSPAGASRKELKASLEYPGSLSGFAAKAEIAYLTRYITADMKRSIDILRRLRNDVAHSPEFFRLKDHEQQLRHMFELGPGIPATVNRMGIELLVASVTRRLLNLQKPFSESPEPLFGSPREVIEYIADEPELIETLEPHRLRWELGMGVALLCSLIVYYREEAVRQLGKGLIVGVRSVGQPEAAQSVEDSSAEPITAADAASPRR